MAVTYNNVFYDYVLDPLRDALISEFNYGSVYISPVYQDMGNLSIRLFGTESEVETYDLDHWTKKYTIEIAMYLIEPNADEGFYKQLYNDSERLFQLLFTNKTKETTIGSTTFKWFGGVVEEVSIDDLEDDEVEVEGLHSIKTTFECFVSS
tara:strand:- start:1549 stop:2001 length:453 start_codon:yes stop_codon:yes gene_type:complete